MSGTVALLLGGLLLSLFGIVAAMYLRSKVRPGSERFVVITEGLAKRLVTDEDQPYLYTDSNVHRASIRSPVRYWALFKCPDEFVSIMPKTTGLGHSVLVTLNPLLERWADCDPLLILKLEAHLDPEKFVKLRSSKTQLRAYLLSELTAEVISWTGSLSGMAHLTVELLAPSFSASGQLRQRQALDGPAKSFVWNLSATNVGRHQVGLRLSLENSAGTETRPVGVVMRTVTAVDHGLLSPRRVDIILKTSQAAAASVGVLLALRALGRF